jgi:uncharacterized protein (TIGR02145 family)
MKYKGKELKEITTPQVFDPPKQMLVWDCKAPFIQTVYAVIRTVNGTTQVVCNGSLRCLHCADIPEEPKPRRATNRELAKWLAQGNGEWGISKCGVIEKAEIGWFYDTGYENQTLQSALRVRNWDDTEWHEPTVDYMGIEDKQVQDAKPIARYAVTDQYGNEYSVRCTENGLKVFPTPVSIEKSDEIISAALRQYPELANERTATFDHNVTPERIDGEREISEADLLNRACSDKNFFKEDEVEVGNQTWMARNLDINDGGEGIYFNHDNGEYYYTWEAAKRIADKIPGWHLPSNGEWDELLAVANTKSLMGEGYWCSRFDVKPTGYWNENFISDSMTTNFWSSSIDETCESNAWRIYMSKTPYFSWESRRKSLGFSVRLVKDR